YANGAWGDIDYW
nr:immunoglobulin heavy chain junction region [Macaca mulatta]